MSNEAQDPRLGQETKKSVRPWGDIHMLVRNQMCSVDLTRINPGGKASLHSHAVRSELFHFIDDGAFVEIDGEIHRPKAGDEIMMRPGMKHRFWAVDKEFRILVISFGKWDVEDQERHEDDYGRKGQKVEL